MTGPLLIVAALGTAGFAVLLWQLRKATTAPLTANRPFRHPVRESMRDRSCWVCGVPGRTVPRGRYACADCEREIRAFFAAVEDDR